MNIKQIRLIAIFWSMVLFPLLVDGASSNHLQASMFEMPRDTATESLQNESLSPGQLEARAEELLLKVTTENRFIGLLATDKPYPLPVGIQKSIAGMAYTIVLDDLRIDSEGATVKAYMTLKVPGTSTKLGFYADNVRLGPEGLETAQLRLIRDKEVPMGSFSLTFKSSRTMVEWDCNGYKSTSTGGDVVFPASLITPLNGARGDSTIMGGFSANFTDLKDVLLNFSMEPFMVNGLSGFEFHPQDVSIDLGDARNPAGINFPVGFFPPGHPFSLQALWTGIHIPNFTVVLPKGLGSEEGISVSAQNMIIDDQGITGNLMATQLLSLENGRVGGWEFSVDTLRMGFMKNAFTNFRLAGEIKLPISDEDKGFRYGGMIESDGNMSFMVSYDQALQANLWGANLTIDPNSLIAIDNINGKFQPRALLHGSMSVALSGEVELAAFAFQDMQITPEEPYFSIGTCEASSGLLSGFPVTISEITFQEQNELVGLSMTASVNLMSSDESGFGADGSFTIWAERTESQGLLGYKYENTQIDGFYIDVDQGAFAFEGAIEVYRNDAVYGKGFKGMVAATFSPGIQVQASAQFGTVDDYRYWYVDALAGFPSGMMVVTGMGIYGFGGGASYHMQMAEPSGYAIPDDSSVENDNSESPGISLSGANYVPDKTIGLGLSASVILGTHPSPNAANGQVSFRIQFHAGGGIESIRFAGDAVMASELGSDPGKASMRLTMNIAYNFTEKDLYGVNEVFVNIADGVVKGINANNSAGQVVFRFNEQEWYVHVGTPDHRVGLEVMKIFRFGSYFMVGTNIPPFPEIPQKVYNFMGKDISSSQLENAQSVDAGIMGSGSGFAFGSAFDLDTGEQEFLIFYGWFSLGAGFDIMLRDFGPDAFCAGSTPPIGVNGWYAMGQAYAYVGGNIGVQFKLFGKDRKMDILTITAAALLKAKMPNPVYFSGKAGGTYDIMGGMVKGNCSFEFEVGDDCQVMGANPLGNITVISDISPTQGNTDVSVFVTPQVAFNMAIDKSFSLLDENNQRQSFRVRLDYFRVKMEDQEFAGEAAWNAASDVISWETSEIYDEFKTVTVEVRVIFQRLHNGRWVNFVIEGKQQAEEQSITFTTGERPDYIRPEDVEYSYPVPGMMNFHWKEHNTAYFKLSHNYNYLFKPEADWRTSAILEGGSSDKDIAYTYDPARLEISFTVPDNLSAETVYNLRISKVPTTVAAEVDANVERQVVSSSDTHEQREANIEGKREVSLERTFYQLKLRTSKYATFGGKLDDMVLGSSSKQIVTTGIENLIKFASMNERFDEFELKGKAWGQSLVGFEMDLRNNVWFKEYIEPLVYEGYPINNSLTLTWRDVNIMGVPPLRAIYGYQTASYETANDKSIGKVYSYGAASLGIKYTGVVIMNQDYQHLKNAASKLYQPNGSNPQAYLRLMDGFFYPIFNNLEYVSKIKYILPGENTVTTESEIVFKI